MVIAWPVSLSKISIQHLLPPITGHGFEQPDIEGDTQFTVHGKGNGIVLGVEGHAQNLEGWKTLAHYPAQLESAEFSAIFRRPVAARSLRATAP
jgi:hypothetical protein